MTRFALLAVSALAALALTAGPATGGSRLADGAAACRAVPVDGSTEFDGLVPLLLAGAATRGTRDVGREATVNATYESLPASAVGKAGKGFHTTVPVWFHVITGGATGSVTDAQIADQIRVLNRGFAGYYGGAGSGFTFQLAGITRTDNATWFDARAGGDAERDMKRALHRGGFETLNVYSNLAGGYLGYAYLPGLPDSRLYLDGVVLHWESMPGTSTTFAGRYDLGMTLVHETGHWVNLEHTFFGGCNAKGDFVDDTPAELVATTGCPVGKDTCSESGLDPIHNFMDYSYDSCYTEFTPGQAARARDSWLYFRAA